MSALIEAYVTNLGKYAEYGVEAGETLKFPATTEEVQALLKRIGVDGVRYEEIFITAFDGEMCIRDRFGTAPPKRWGCTDSSFENEESTGLPITLIKPGAVMVPGFCFC